jgi:hypothetical protein
MGWQEAAYLMVRRLYVRVKPVLFSGYRVSRQNERNWKNLVGETGFEPVKA